MKTHLLFCLILTGICAIYRPAFAQNYHWQWAAGGRGYSEGLLVAADPWGNVFGAASSVHYSDTFGSTVLGNYGKRAALVVKYDASGKLQWANNSINSFAIPVSMGTDVSGNLYLLGIYSDTSLTMGAYTLHNQDTLSRYFLAKLNSAGAVIWLKNICKTGLGYIGYQPDGGGLVVNGKSIYIAVPFKIASINVGGFTLNNANSSGSTIDILLAEFDDTGNVVWAQREGGNDDDIPYCICISPSGNFYVSGYFLSSSITFGNTTLVLHPNPLYYDVFVTKYTPQGNVIWSRSAYGRVIGKPTIACDADENLFMHSIFDSSFIWGNDTLHEAGPSCCDPFVAKFDSAGNEKWAKEISTKWVSYNAATDPCGNIWIAAGRGFSTFTDSMVDGHYIPVPANKQDPLLVAGWTTNGTFITADILPSGGDDVAAICTDGVGNVFIGGDYYRGPYTFGNSTLNADYENLYVAKFSNNTDTTTEVHTMACIFDSAVLQASGGYHYYLWYDGSMAASHRVDFAGTYWVICTGRCDTALRIDTFKILNRTIGLNVSLGPDTIVCAPLVLSIQKPGATFLWQDSSFSNADTARISGTYFVTINDSGCSVSDTIQIRFINLAQHLNDTLLCSDEPIHLLLQANLPMGANILWSTGTADTAVIASDTGQYWVRVSEAACIETDTMRISAVQCNCLAYIPVAFTPNDDNKNDRIGPLFANSCVISDLNFSIYNRFGEQVFISHTPGGKWDGKWHNIAAETGTYFYQLEYKSGLQGKRYFKKGDITLIR